MLAVCDEDHGQGQMERRHQLLCHGARHGAQRYLHFWVVWGAPHGGQGRSADHLDLPGSGAAAGAVGRPGRKRRAPSAGTAVPPGSGAGAGFLALQLPCPAQPSGLGPGHHQLQRHHRPPGRRDHGRQLHRCRDQKRDPVLHQRRRERRRYPPGQRAGRGGAGVG